MTKVGEFSYEFSQCLTSVTDGEEEDSKEAQKKLEEKFAPLLEWLKEETKDVVRDGKQACRVAESLLIVVFQSSSRIVLSLVHVLSLPILSVTRPISRN